jgi:hypothetical protein
MYGCFKNSSSAGTGKSMIFFRIIFLVFGLLAVHTAMGQRNSIKASLSKNRLLIGEPVELTIESKVHPTSGLSFVAIDSIPHFEILEKPALDSSSVNEELTYKAIYKITSFDSGHWVIPSFSLAKNVRTDTIPVDVVFSDFDPSQEYHDIKDILEVDIKKKKFPWWWYAGGAVVLIAVFIYLLKRKKPVVKAVVPKPTISPYDEAITALEQLQRNKPEAKQYYSKLTGIFRLYLYRKKGILSLQKTTDDLVVQLKNLNLGKEQFDKLSQSLRLGDFVKFAKYIPGEEDDKTVYGDILHAIKTIEQPVAQ